MKLGILGTGMIVQDFGRCIEQLNFEKVYVLGTQNTLEETKDYVNKHHLTGYTIDYDEMLNKLDVDTIYVALPNHLHYAFAKKALLAGKHVILEKPSCSNAIELEELIDIAKEKNLVLVEAMSIFYMPAYKELCKKVQTLGDLKIVSFNYSQYSSRYNAFKEGKVLPAFDYTKSGGALMDINVYNIAALVGIFGMPKEVHYYANVEKNIDTSGMVIMDYDHFKVQAIGAKDCSAPMSNTIQGNQGFITLDTSINNLRHFYVGKERIDFEENTHRMVYEFDYFIDLVDNLKLEEANKEIERSLMVSKVIQQARYDANIYFSADKKED